MFDAHDDPLGDCAHEPPERSGVESWPALCEIRRRGQQRMQLRQIWRLVAQQIEEGAWIVQQCLKLVEHESFDFMGRDPGLLPGAVRALPEQRLADVVTVAYRS